MKISTKRRRGLEFHIRINDYFGTLATVLDLLRQDMEQSDEKQKNTELLRRVRDDLQYLQESHEIRQKRKNIKLVA